MTKLKHTFRSVDEYQWKDSEGNDKIERSIVSFASGSIELKCVAIAYTSVHQCITDYQSKVYQTLPLYAPITTEGKIARISLYGIWNPRCNKKDTIRDLTQSGS